MPQTKNKKPTLAEQQAELSAEMEAEYQQAEQVLRDAATSGKRLSFDQAAFVKSRMGLADDTALKSELRRITNLIQLELIAGRQADRQAAQKLAQEAAEQLASEGESLRQVIQEAQQSLAKMEKAANTTQKRSDQMHQAGADMQQYLPPHVKAKHSQTKAAIKESLGRKFKDLKTQLDHTKLLAGCGGLSWSSREYAELIKFHYNGRFHRQQGHHVVFDSSGFEPVRKELAETIPALQAECDTAQAEFEAALAKNDELLDYYSAR